MYLLCDAFPPFAQEAVGAFFFLVLWFGKRHLLLVSAILVGEEYDDVGTFEVLFEFFGQLFLCFFV